MATEYKVIHDAWCWTNGQKARKIERHLNQHARDGWNLSALDPVVALGCDVGFYLVLAREERDRS